jgi:hypothetical protein
MKNVIIGILSLALCIAGFLTRPTEDNYRAFVQKHRDAAGGALARAEFKDCWLWVEVRVDGKTVVAGLFSHWWDRSGGMERA